MPVNQHTGGSVAQQITHLHDLLGLGRDPDRTPDPDDESYLGLGGDEEPALGLGLAAVLDRLPLGLGVLVVVLLGGRQELLGVGLGLFGGGLLGGGLGIGDLRLRRLLLQDGFGSLHGLEEVVDQVQERSASNLPTSRVVGSGSKGGKK
jgi:hypothetical protein